MVQFSGHPAQRLPVEIQKNDFIGYFRLLQKGHRSLELSVDRYLFSFRILGKLQLGYLDRELTKIRSNGNNAYLATVNDNDIFEGAILTVFWNSLCRRFSK